MRRKLARVLVLIVALSMLMAGFAFSAGAQKTDKKDDAFDRVTYVNTDNGIVQCLPTATPDGVSIHDPTTGSTLVGAGPGLSEDIQDPLHGNNVCLGGAIFSIDSDTDPTSVHDLETADEWAIWAQEELEHQLGGQSCQVDDGDKLLCPSGFAQIRSTYTYDTGSAPAPSCQPAGWETQVCLQEPFTPSDTVSLSWVTHKTVVCNDLVVDLDQSVLGADDAENAWGATPGTHVETEHLILFFLSGPDIVLDCFTPPVLDPIEDLKPLVSSVMCSDDPTDPHPASPVGSDELPNLVCFVDHPVPPDCTDRAGTVGTVGTIGTNFGAVSAPGYFCSEYVVSHDDVRELQGTEPVVAVENVPVQIDS